MNTNVPIRQGKIEAATTRRAGLCDCGNPATRQFNGWECDECYEARKRMEADERRYTMHHSTTARYAEMSEREKRHWHRFDL